MATAFGLRLLGTALVVISAFYRFPRQRTRVGFLSDHCRRIEVNYQSGSKQRRPKGSADLCARFSYFFPLMVALNVAAWSQPLTGAISGRVVTEDGQPVPRATVLITASGKADRRVSINTDEEGNFRAEGLDAAAYVVSASAPGYVVR